MTENKKFEVLKKFDLITDKSLAEVQGGLVPVDYVNGGSSGFRFSFNSWATNQFIKNALKNWTDTSTGASR
ncbi:MAG: hypothetical protein LBI13_04920 [Streptococcaceae bacterium]|jgi:hypothetical protein|nr:hypothetical protein [Streptococcaceae bacterium]